MIRTVWTGNSASGTDTADNARIRAICKLIPVRCIGLQVFCFEFDCEVYIVSGEGFTRVQGPSSEFGVVEDFE